MSQPTFLQKQILLLVSGGILLSTAAVLVVTGTEGFHTSIGTAALKSEPGASPDEFSVHSNNTPSPSSAKLPEDLRTLENIQRSQTTSPAGTVVKGTPTESPHPKKRPRNFGIAKISRGFSHIDGSGDCPPIADFSKPTVPDIPLVYKITDETFQKRLPHVPLEVLDSIRSEFDKQAGVGELAVDDPEYARRWTLAGPTATDRMRILFGWAAVAEFQRQALLPSDGGN